MLFFDAGGGSSDRLFELVVSTCADVYVVTAEFSVEDSIEALEEMQGLVISGRRKASSRTDKLVAALLKRAVERGMPIIGVCYGAQVLNTFFGGTLEILPQRLKGLQPVLFDAKDPAFRELPVDHARFYEARARRIKRLASRFKPIAWSSWGIEAFRDRGGPLYGFMFHPELSGGAGIAVMRSTLRYLGLA